MYSNNGSPSTTAYNDQDLIGLGVYSNNGSPSTTAFHHAYALCAAVYSNNGSPSTTAECHSGWDIMSSVPAVHLIYSPENVTKNRR